MTYQSGAITHGMVEFVAWWAAHSSWEDLREIRPYIAVGRGDSDWDAPGAGAPVGTETTLEDELCRIKPYLFHPLDATKFDQGKLLYTEDPGDIMRFVAHFTGSEMFPESIDGAYIREFGLFVHADGAKDSGLLTLLVRHGKTWWDRDWKLRKELIVDLRV